MENTATKIGKYVRYRREKDDMSLNEFAKRSKLTASFILRLENGSYKTVKVDIIEKLSQALNMTLQEFLAKCEILPSGKTVLPSLDFYLKEKFQFPDQAVDDVKLFLSLLENKYKPQLDSRRKAHENYWRSEKHQ